MESNIAFSEAFEELQINDNSNPEKNLPILPCNSCSKVFKCKRSLADHQKIHTGEKPYACSFEGCEKRFTQYSSLQKHERVHNGEKPYKCHYPECPQNFSQISNMRRHYRTHTHEKPFACDLCGKRFNTSSNLKQHNEIHKTDDTREKFTCFICTRVYLHISSLKKHLKKHNKNYLRNSDVYSSDISQDISNSTVMDMDESMEMLSTGELVVKSEVKVRSENSLNSPRILTPRLVASNSKRNEEVIFFALEDDFIEPKCETKIEEFPLAYDLLNFDSPQQEIAVVKEEFREDSILGSRHPSCTCEFSSSMFHEHLCPFKEFANNEVKRANAFALPDTNFFKI